jgi:hypothetical protein
LLGHLGFAGGKSFPDALAHVKTWKTVGEHLELFDVGGSLLARFEAR